MFPARGGGPDDATGALNGQFAAGAFEISAAGVLPPAGASLAPLRLIPSLSNALCPAIGFEVDAPGSLNDRRDSTGSSLYRPPGTRSCPEALPVSNLSERDARDPRWPFEDGSPGLIFPGDRPRFFPPPLFGGNGNAPAPPANDIAATTIRDY
eukprot:31534-Pelagococcus_subviridis.AAC.3